MGMCSKRSRPLSPLLLQDLILPFTWMHTGQARSRSDTPEEYFQELFLLFQDCTVLFYGKLSFTFQRDMDQRHISNTPKSLLYFVCYFSFKICHNKKQNCFYAPRKQANNLLILFVKQIIQTVSLLLQRLPQRIWTFAFFNKTIRHRMFC